MEQFTTLVGDRYERLMQSFEKARKAEIGEIRTWSGEKFQRTKDGWKYIGKAEKQHREPSPIKSKPALTEENFQGWPDWDERGDITQPNEAVEEILANEKFQKDHSFTDFYWNNDNEILFDYLNSDLDLDDKRYIAAGLELTGMLSTDVPGFEFTEPIKEPVLYEDELGNEDIAITYCYDPDSVPKEIRDLGTFDKETGNFYVWSRDIEQGTFKNRAGGKMPKAGLKWCVCPGGYSATVPGYWAKDSEAKKDMMKYCGFEEYKKGKLV